MKKLLFAGIGLSLFILGVVFSDLILSSINAIAKKEIFVTRTSLENKLSDCLDLSQKFQSTIKQNQAQFDNLIKEMNNKDFYALTKENLLSSPAINAAEDDLKILLKPGTNEMLLKPGNSDNPSVEQIKESVNNKITAILDVSKGILREKITKLNLELMDMNNRLREKNLSLNESLQALQTYKKELDEYKQYNTKLEGIRLDLEKVVQNLETKIEDGRLKVNFKGDILFESGSHHLIPQGIQLLQSIFPVLKENEVNYDIFIAGHTDNVPIRTDARHKYESNWELSTYRAIEVVKHLTKKGLDPANLAAAGYGEFKPIDNNQTTAGKTKNRRVELFLIPKIIKRTNQQTD
jgi:chemotaxis protein MotB